MRYFLFLAILGSFFYTQAQENENKQISNFHFSKAHFNVGLRTGFMGTRILNSNGPVTPDAFAGPSYELNTDFTYNLTPKLGLFAGLAAGAQPHRIYVDEIERGRFVYLQDFNYEPFAELSIGLSYNHKIKSFYTQSRLAATQRFGRDYSLMSGLSNEFNNSVNYTLSTNPNAHLGLMFSQSLLFPLKNGNMIRLGGFMKYMTQAGYTADYTINVNGSQSTGSFTESQLYGGFEVGFVLTQAKKAYRRMQLAQEKGLVQDKAINKEFRLENRLSKRTKGWHFRTQFSNFFTTYKTNSANLNDAFSWGNAFGFGTEYHLDKYYFEADLFSYRSDLSIETAQQSGFRTDAINGILLQAGIGKRIFVGNQFHLFNVSAGFGLNGITNANRVLSSNEHNQPFFSTQSVLKLDYALEIDRRINPFFYLTVSKDFRLFKNVFLELGYRRSFGLTNAVENYVLTYTGQGNPPTRGKYTNRFSAGQFFLGLKLKF